MDNLEEYYAGVEMLVRGNCEETQYEATFGNGYSFDEVYKMLDIAVKNRLADAILKSVNSISNGMEVIWRNMPCLERGMHEISVALEGLGDIDVTLKED